MKKNAQIVIMINMKVKNVIHVIAQKVKCYVCSKSSLIGAFVLITIYHLFPNKKFPIVNHTASIVKELLLK